MSATREQFDAERAERKEAMTALRNAVKASRYSYRQLAGYSGNSSSWVGIVLRGDYPYCGGNMLPKNIRLVLESCGFKIDPKLVTF